MTRLWCYLGHAPSGLSFAGRYPGSRREQDEEFLHLLDTFPVAILKILNNRKHAQTRVIEEGRISDGVVVV